MLKLIAWALSVWAVLFTPSVFAQSHLGGLRGRVSDSTGASIAQAKITLINQGSNSVLSTVSNDQGEFAFASLTPGTYRLTAEMTGFKKFDRPNLLIETQGFHSVDIKLEVGDFTQSVQVTEEAPLMETVIPTTGGALQSRQLESLPNIGRNPFMALAKAAPNIVPVGDTRYQRFQDQSGTSQITIAGGPSYGNAFLVDGVPVTAIDNRTTLIPSIEAVQEVKLQANTYDAEMGRTAGGVFNTFLKSGNNQLHGSLFGYYRDPEWAANDFFRNRANIARPNQSWKNFGASIGAPVVIPKLYNGQNKTFFWIAQEAYRQKEGFAQDFSVPTLAERAGDFSQSINRTGTLQQIYDPLTTTQNDQGVYVRTPFADNKIPANRINGIGAKVASYFPQPSRAASFHGANNYSASSLVDNRGDQYDFKVDHEFARWWRANASYIHYKSEEPGSTWFPNIATTAGTRLNRKTDAMQVNNTFTVNPTTVVDIRYGFNRWPNLYRTVSAGFNPADLGFTGSWLGDVQYLKFPRFDMGLFTSLGAEADAQWAVYHSKNLLGNVSKLLGRHAFRMGGAYRRINVVNQAFGYSAGQFSFSDTFTRADYRATDNRTGSSIAELLLGIPGGGTAQISSKFYQYVDYYAGYFQDNFRVRPNLTLNLGLRYEWETGLMDRNNALIVGFDRQASHPIGQGAKGTLLYAGLNGNPTHVLNPNKNKLAPRVGLAYQLNAKTTLRGGYGIFWGPPSWGSGFNTLGYTQVSQFIGTIDGGRTPNGNFTNPFPTGLVKPVGNADGPNAGVGQSISFPDQNAKSAYAHQFSFDVQRVLPGNLLVTAGYVGSRSRNFLYGTGSVNINQLPVSQFGSNLFDLVPNPFFGRGGTGVVAAQTITRGQALRPFPQFGAVSLTFGDFNHQRYDSLAVKVERRLSRDMTFLASWTWSQNKDIAIGPPNNQNAGAGAPQNAYDLEAEYALSLLDIKHRLTGAFNYELPFGKGKSWLSNNTALDLVAGGWQLNFLTVIQTGFPLAVTQANQNAITGASLQRPNSTGTAPDAVVSDKLEQWINPAAFSAAPAFSFGNLSRTIDYRMPGQANWDISMFKTFTIYERFKAQFRAEALNAFNTPMMGRPDTTFGNPTFGRVTTQRNFPRLIQLGIRVLF